VVPDHGEERDVGVTQVAECGDAALEVLEARTAIVEEVTCVDDGVDVAVDRVGDHRLERRQEVTLAFRRVVLSVADVGVARVNHPSHGRGLFGMGDNLL
jgi:hypothetical protein